MNTILTLYIKYNTINERRGYYVKHKCKYQNGPGFEATF